MTVIGVCREANIEHGEVSTSAMHADFFRWQARHVRRVRYKVRGARRNWRAEGGAAGRRCLALIHDEFVGRIDVVVDMKTSRIQTGRDAWPFIFFLPFARDSTAIKRNRC